MAHYIIDTEDEFEHRRYLAGPKALADLSSYAEALRAKYKYSSTPPESWEEVRELFFDHCGELLRDQEDY